MKALILSDSHRCFAGIRNAVEENPDINLIIHAGDVQRDVDEIMETYPQIPCAYVLGNNDYFVHDVPFERIFEFGGKRIFLTHGHKYSVKISTSRVTEAAKHSGADICIFGHTHEQHLSNNGIWLINPGSAARGYALLTIKNGEISAELKNAQR